jgi:cellulose synthase/poly-beta-1,6-N-acetylglucosamine synthase-like glycosyltransferase
LIPARNEAQTIKLTLESLKKQTSFIDRIIVVTNNCTDNTGEIASRNGAEVIIMPENKDMKAGALNYGLHHIIPNLENEDLILIMDADTVLSPNLVEKCQKCFSKYSNVGAVSSIFTGRDTKSLLGTLQMMEYCRYKRQIMRNGWRAFVLTGTASIFKVKTLKDVKTNRLNGNLPNNGGSYYDTFGRTEDNEMTLAILKLGYDCPAANAFSQTDVMDKLGKFILQRERWYNGALINLKSYGFSLPWNLRWIYWKQQIGLFLSLVFFLLMFITISLSVCFNLLTINVYWIIPLLILAFERTATVWSLGWRARIIALSILPEQIYSIIPAI